MTNRPTALLTLLVLFLEVTHESSLSRHRVHPEVNIIGGRPAEIWEYPYQVSIQQLDQHFCGGSIISPKYILTAAHCFLYVSENEISVRAGSSIVLDGGSLVKVQKINSHPEFNLSTMDYDIAILELEDALNYSRNIQPVKLPPKNTTFVNSVGTVTGWGITDSGFESTQLMMVYVPIVSHEECVEDLRGVNINSRQICAGTKQGGKDSCTGDSGGPLTINGAQAGIVSWGDGCGEPNKPGIYTSVGASEIRKFIEEITGI